ncbi:hypothetical protein WDJ51_13245 [Rathayibacter sp. YIM 133350]|uniref:hypothetical protein n=1 Tax=Rathayibacter sp. YIM 133350 TaxID=3131992 RepID=UPI00307F7CF6
MSQSPLPEPSRRDLLRPVEMVVGALIASAFVGVIVLMATREIGLAAIALGVVFIITLVVLAMFAMTWKADDSEVADLDEQDGDGAHH